MNPAAGGSSHSSSQAVIVKQLKDAFSQRARVIFVDQESSLLISNYFRDGARTGSDDWNPSSHGFYRRDPEHFVPDRRERENIGIVIEINQLRTWNKAAKSNLSARLRRQALLQVGEISSGIGRR